MAPPKKTHKAIADDATVKKKPVRRDMDKRREQNRQSQRTYQQKQRIRIKELERLAAAYKAPGGDSSPSEPTKDNTTVELGPPELYTPHQPFAPSSGLIDPALLALPSTSLISSPTSHITPANFLHLDPFAFPPDTDIFFNCGCSTLHVPAPASPFLLPIRPRAFSLHANTLRLDVECVLSALLRNCHHLGLSKGQFCADESESLFYRPLLLGSQEEDGFEDEARTVVGNPLTLFRTVKHDLRPSSSQITESHHPYIDVLPFRDLRESLVAMQGQIDEDEFLHDWFNQASCWGGIKGSRGGGMPWEGRNWEVSEGFLSKWEVVTGGDEGELARGSRWWREMRDEVVEECV